MLPQTGEYRCTKENIIKLALVAENAGLFVIETWLAAAAALQKPSSIGDKVHKPLPMKPKIQAEYNKASQIA